VENRIILKKNTPLPCEASQMFYTLTKGQSEVSVTVTQAKTRPSNTSTGLRRTNSSFRRTGRQCPSKSRTATT